MTDNSLTPLDALAFTPEETDRIVSQTQDNEELFEDDYSVYADRGPNCIDWSDNTD